MDGDNLFSTFPTKNQLTSPSFLCHMKDFLSVFLTFFKCLGLFLWELKFMKLNWKSVLWLQTSFLDVGYDV
ncbi:MAG TPA: hypothetical protein EYP30_09940 [Archaeoglobaceae archaeon]|nr:hypothetical protein [Archaeoglobaceae archaeon]